MSKTVIRRFLSEFLGTFGLVFAAAGAVMVDDLSGGSLNLIGIALCSGLAVMAMIYIFGRVSGAHINPAITFGFALTKYLSWTEASVYLAAQIGGAVGAAQILRNFFGLVANLGSNAPDGSPLQSAALEMVLTFFLMSVIMTTTINQKQFGSVAGLVIGGTVTLCTLIGAPISGGSMNPARSFGPALISGTWSNHWVYWIGPLLGSAIGAISASWLLNDQTKSQFNHEASPSPKRIHRIMFACVHNSGRSQMAEGFAKQYWPGAVAFQSAGTDPGGQINPLVLRVMKEKGIDLLGNTPKQLTQEMYDQSDRVITMGCSIADICPTLDETTEDWTLDDPEGKTIEEVRIIRDEIEERVKTLFSSTKAKDLG